MRGTERRGLGRGLGALIPRVGSGLLEVDIDRIAPSPQQPRYLIDEAALAELVDSIRQHGVLQPLIVTRTGDGEGGEPDESGDGGYTLVAGERRWRAARAAGLRTVPVVVKEATPRQRLELALVENLQRQDLNPLETAQAYRQLIDEHELTQEAVAERVGKNRATVANALRLLHLPAEARDALARGALSEGHARAILACGTAADRRTLLRAILERGLSVRQAEELARRLNAGAAEPPPDRQSREVAPDVAALEDRFRRALGTKVQLSRGRRGGKLIVYFFSDDELQGLYDAICGAGGEG
jgi:ParB family transcriptional regulator, chromosome partitioning protein